MADDTNNEFTNYEESDDNVQAIFTLNLTPSKTSQLINDSGFISSIEGLTYNELANKPQINGVTLVGNKTTLDLSLVGENTNQTLTNKTINANNNTISNLTVDNFNSNSISLSNDINYPTEVPENLKLATDLSLSTALPLCGESPDATPIRNDEEEMDMFYNIGFALKNNSAHIAATNEVANGGTQINCVGDFQYNTDMYLYTPDFKVSMPHGGFDQILRYYGSKVTQNLDSRVHTKLTPMRKYSLALLYYYTLIGLDRTEYHSNTERERNYTWLPTYNADLGWFIPITVYRVFMTGYKNSEVTNMYGDAVTLEPGNEGETCEAESFYWHWFECDYLNPPENMVGWDNDEIEIKYTGDVYQGWQSIGVGGEPFTLCTIDNPWDEENADYKEVLPTRYRSDMVQEVEDSNGNKGWVIIYDYSDQWNKESGYTNQPGNYVEEWQTIYNVNATSTEDTIENTGDFKYTFRIFQVPYFDDTNKIAYKAYELSKGDDIIQWTSVAGQEDEAFYGMSANTPNEVQWAYNFQDRWYQVDNEGQTYYVNAHDLEEYGGMTEPPVIGEYVPEHVGLYSDPRNTDSYVKDAGNEDTTFTTDEPEVIYQYTGETAFIYENEVRDELESFFDDENWGIYKNNFDGTFTKVDEAYQWGCKSSYEVEYNKFLDIYPSYQNDIANVQPQIDFSIEGINWWLMQVWEVEDTVTGVKSYIGIPPTYDPVEDGDYSDFEGQQIQYNEAYPCLPVDSNGYAIECDSNTVWEYTGNYNDDFLDRWTKLQNGEL